MTAAWALRQPTEVDRENAEERKCDIRRDSVARPCANPYHLIPRFSRFRNFVLSLLS